MKNKKRHKNLRFVSFFVGEKGIIMKLKYDEYMKLVEPDKYGKLVFNYDAMLWENPQRKETHSAKKKKKRMKRRKKISRAVRETVIKRDNMRCVKCGNRHNLQVHHIIHRKHGGSDEASNLITLCAACHAQEHRSEPVYNIMKKAL